MRCAHCQTDAALDATGRCASCGASHPPRPVCADCGFTNPDGFRFCGQCGSALGPAEAVASADGGERGPGTLALRDSTDEGNGSRLETEAAARRVTSDAITFDDEGSAPVDTGAERRQLTILFCDLVGSTRLSHRMDPEDYHALLMAYRATCVRSIAHYGGSEVRHIGDGTQAYFGYPRALEEAAERAVLTALDIIDAVARLARSPRWTKAGLAVRIGIGSGTVITDRQSAPDGVGRDLTEALGEPPNLAARIQSVAPVNSVVIGPLTRQLLGNLFTLIDRGEQTFKGIDHPVRVWQVAGIAAVDRFEATRSPRAALVDRERELPQLLALWDEARAGQGRVVVLSGEGGVGKSRLARALHERIVRRELPSSLFLQCSSIYSNTALYPVIAAVRAQAEFADGESAAVRADKLRRSLERSSVPAEGLLPLLAALLDIRDEAATPPPPVDWRELRERLIDALVEHVCRLADRRPLLIVFEDLQWIDPSTSELLERAVHAIVERRVMILAVCRPEVLLPWFGSSHVTVLSLRRLSQEHTATLACHAAGNRTLPMELQAEIAAKTGGVPLFVEEIVRTLLSSGLLRVEGDACVLDGPLPPLAIPPTLTDSLMARLDRLGTDRRFAQFGAVIGREFTRALIAAVAAEPEEAVADSLEALVDAGILSCWGNGKTALYTFSHAMMREAALESMLHSQRQRMHARVAGVLESRFPAIGQANPELLARHYSEAAQTGRAIEQWLLAGRKASARSETREAIAHLRSGLALVPVEEPGEAMDARHLELLIALGPALITHRGPGADEVRENYRQALALCARLPESPAHFAAYWGWWRIARNFGDKRDAANTLLSLAERLGDPGLALEAHHALWATNFVLGEQSTSLRHIREGLALYADGDYRDHAATYGGHDAEVCGEGEAALVLWLTGHPKEALRRVERALALADSLEHVGSQAHALDYALMLHFYRRDVEAVRRHAATQLALSAEHHFSDYEMRALVFHGWASGLVGEHEGGLQAIRKGVLAQRSSGTTEDFPIFFAMQAELHLEHGQTEEADVMLTEASDYATEQRVLLWDAEIHRLHALVALRARREGREGAREHLTRALDIAVGQGALMLEYKTIETIARAFAFDTASIENEPSSAPAVGTSPPEPRVLDIRSLDEAMSDVLRGERPLPEADAAAEERRRHAAALLGRRAASIASP